MQPKTGLLASVIIKKTEHGLFDILHTRDFNPNSKDLIIYKERLSADSLGKVLIALCDVYYGLLSDGNALQQDKMLDAEAEHHIKIVTIHQCQNCLSIYDKDYGDQFNNAPAGTDFQTIENYICPVCESTADCFKASEKHIHTV